MIILRLLLLAALFVPVPAVATRVLERFPVELSARDREQVIVEACQVPYGIDAESISGWSFEKDGRVEGADAICVSSRRISGIPMQHSARCLKQRRRWSCEGFGLSAYVSSTRSRLYFNLRELDAAVAVEMVEAVVRQQGFNDVDLRQAVEGRCSISKLDDYSWELSCENARLMVTRDEFPDGGHQFRVFLADHEN